MFKSFCTLLLINLLPFFSNGQDPEVDFDQANRPQFHFSSPKNWVGHPAATLYVDSVYHLFYEYSPIENSPVYLQMGHAVSKDLLHWDILPVALEPDNDTRDLYRCTVRSGSAIVDGQNLLGKQIGGSKTLVLFYASFECGIRMAYSTDGGKNWKKYAGNPLIPFLDGEYTRDPRVIWYEPAESYVMILARNPKDNDVGDGFSFYTSSNLVDWTYESHIVGPQGRPDMFQLPVNRRPDDMRWVLTDSIGSYIIGDFDGKSFTVETSLLKNEYGSFGGSSGWEVPGNDGVRRIQMASLGTTAIEGMPFAGQMSIPVEMGLHKYLEGVRLVKQPVKEVEQLQEKSMSIENKNIIPGLDKNPIKRLKGDCVRLVGTFQLKTLSSFGFMVRCDKDGNGTEIRFDATRNQISCLGKIAPLEPEDGKIKLDILVDRSSIEIFANDGKVVLSGQFSPAIDSRDFILYNTGGELFIEKLDIYPMRSIYPQKK
ncbi:glycoside hydrolase family 32 protein [Mangrovibacterium sp.]|uniref:glycoside hydrolase family 32 protein n=1 Tax=Mangrovibacterium sp. TaxID=1961364 RepID=UPI0035689A1E